MKKPFAAAMAIAVSLTLPLMGLAQSAGHRQTAIHKEKAHTKVAAAPMYICPICHHKADAALAKQVHYICPVDGGNLVRVKPANK